MTAPDATRAAERPRVIAHDGPPVALRFDEWHDDDGAVCWWLIEGWLGEPPYVGTPDDSDWPYDPDSGYGEDIESRIGWTPLPDYPRFKETTDV